MKLQLKRSNVLEIGAAKEPTAAQMEYGELAVNYNNGDPAIFIKDSADNIIRIAGKGNISSGDTPSGDAPPNTGNNVGDIFFNTIDNTLYYWDGSQWVPIASEENAADIFVGTLAEIDVAIIKTERKNGFLWWNTEDGTLYVWYKDGDTDQWVIAVPSGGSGGAGGVNVTISDTEPTTVNSEPGDLWWNTTDGRLYIYYESPTGASWVDASPFLEAPLDGKQYARQNGSWTEVVVGSGDDYVLKSGDTMTGDLTVPSLNDGPLAGFRNIIINGGVQINQRGISYAAAADNTYWADRWKKVPGGMVQVIESGNFTPNVVYTLSGTGMASQQITSPASGNWTTPVIPSTAVSIMLEEGSVATPFERRPIGLELNLCQRYFQAFNFSSTGFAYLPSECKACASYNTTMRVGPTASNMRLGQISHCPSGSGIIQQNMTAISNVQANSQSIALTCNVAGGTMVVGSATLAQFLVWLDAEL